MASNLMSIKCIVFSQKYLKESEIYRSNLENIVLSEKLSRKYYKLI